MKKLFKFFVFSPFFEAEVDRALIRVEKLLEDFPELENQKELGRGSWRVFTNCNPQAARNLYLRWAKDSFAENVISLFLTAGVSYPFLDWLSHLSLEAWAEFLEIMRLNPVMKRWLKIHASGVYQARQALYREICRRRPLLAFVLEEHIKNWIN